MSLKSRIEALTTQISNAKTLLRPISLNKGSIKKRTKKTSSSHNNEM